MQGLQRVLLLDAFVEIYLHVVLALLFEALGDVGAFLAVHSRGHIDQVRVLLKQQFLGKRHVLVDL